MLAALREGFALSKPALSAFSISKKFADVQAVSKVDLSLAQGKCFALLGRNGAGKTTICEMLVGVIAPDCGEIEILGQPFHATVPNKRDLLENIGVLSQETRLYQKFTVGETLSLFASFYAASLDVATVLELMALTAKRNKRLEQLSGGERQRAYLGAALVGDPDLLFLDEPTTGLDPLSRKNVWEIIEDLKQRGRSIFLTTHHMEEAARLADEIAIIERGEIVAQGGPRQLIQRYCEEDVISVQLDQPLPASDLESLQHSFPPARELAAQSYELKTSETFKAIKYLIALCDRLGIIIQSMEFRKSTLEDVFFQLTGKKLP